MAFDLPLVNRRTGARFLMKRTVVIRVICFVLLAACGALCQKRPSVALLPGSQFDDSYSPEVQRQKMRTWNSLPDSPSPVQPLFQDRFRAFIKEASSPLTPDAVAAGVGMRRDITSRLQTGLADLYQSTLAEKESGASAFFSKHLYPMLLKQGQRHYPLTSGSLMDRISYAASRMFVTSDNFGKRKPNTSFFVRALTSAAIHAAYRPNWAQYVNDIQGKR